MSVTGHTGGVNWQSSLDGIVQKRKLKGEIMDLDFTVDTDHRKRRRNRTTQSCLNCHTSKRKCDRKRPCQRCIQLGLTGLCVYEIDDPALRDDPTIDEATRLRNRIAELESLVRELRGKPHPRWADASAGDPSERWHSRAAKNGLQLRRARASSGLLPADNNGINGQQVKPEPLPAEISQPHLYRFTPSPPAPTAYNATGFSPSSSSSLYHPHSSYHQQHGTSYDNGLCHHHQSQQQHHQHQQQFCCSCRTSPSLNALAALGHHHPHSSHQRHPGQHGDPDGSGCLLFKRLSELKSTVSATAPASGIPTNSSSGARGSTSGAGSPYGSPPYGTLPTPTDSEIHSPACGTPFHVSGSVSASGSSPSSPSSGSSSVGGANGGQQNTGPPIGVEWGNYNSYFPLQVSSGMSGVSVNMGVGVGVGMGVGVGGDGGGMYGGIIAT
ncbi:hypothetical protein F5J12DRAFT_800416 [Pisolithus orientalis]|uniref:uncharacterized protein n=1 Tax=Pisolithus orientalis TaxID=936130 RepID=UPI0022255B67|nr:uncharacterized protein F5J12DRAFT_800416 [Pisolithus orientalis]KAI6030437.1 hypothetical protein F5J12DRAFT_800416 [Pisolithus orientalis]